MVSQEHDRSEIRESTPTALNVRLARVADRIGRLIGRRLAECQQVMSNSNDEIRAENEGLGCPHK